MAVWRRAVKPMFDRNKWKILRGDQVMITTGKDSGQTGTVTKVIRDRKFPRVIVEGLNLVGLIARASLSHTSLHHHCCLCMGMKMIKNKIIFVSFDVEQTSYQKNSRQSRWYGQCGVTHFLLKRKSDRSSDKITRESNLEILRRWNQS